MLNSIVFDSNCFWNNYNLDNPIFRTTLKFCSNSDNYQFALPILVKKEVVNNYRKQLQKKYEQIQSNLDWYNKFTERNVKFLSDDEFEDDIIEYEQRLENIIQKETISEIDYPSQRHDEIVKRNLNQQKPFTKNDSGYKDTLIWLNILDLLKLKSGFVYFVSKNKKDFGKNDQLNKSLKKDLHNHDIDVKRIKYFNSPQTFFERIVVPQLNELADDTIEQIRNNSFERFDFYSFINSNIHHWLFENEINIDLFSVSNYLEQPSINMIYSVQTAYLDYGNQISENDILLEFDISLNGSFDILVDRRIPPNDVILDAITITNFDFNPSFMEGEIELDLSARLILTFDIFNNRVINEQLENITIQNYY